MASKKPKYQWRWLLRKDVDNQGPYIAAKCLNLKDAPVMVDRSPEMTLQLAIDELRKGCDGKRPPRVPSKDSAYLAQGIASGTVTVLGHEVPPEEEEKDRGVWTIQL